MSYTVDKQTRGQYMHPVIDQQPKAGDPWQKNYYQPPPLGELVPRTYLSVKQPQRETKTLVKERNV